MRKILPFVLVTAVLLLAALVQNRRSTQREGVVIGVSLLNVSYEFIVNIKEAIRSGTFGAL